VRTVYLLASYLLMPLLMLHLAFRGLRDSDYLQRWGERFGRYRGAAAQGGIVVHAASVGEVNAAAPLIRALSERFPDLPLTVTCFTPTGSHQIRALFGESVYHFYVPFDLQGSTRRFFRFLQPRLLLVMETEIWPNLYFAAAASDVPILIANARISDQSFDAYRRFRSITGPALQQTTRIAAQSDADALRFKQIGAVADRIEVTGNLKFDLKLPSDLPARGEELRQQWGPDRQVLVAGSTHEGDEGPLLDAFHGLLEKHPRALLVLVPRHPERFRRAAQLARDRGLSVQLRSEVQGGMADTQCLVVDKMGELLSYYAAGDIAFVGGSLAHTGGHNVLEPAALSVAVLVGPHTFNFKQVVNALLSCGGARQVANSVELEQAAARLLNEPGERQQMGAAGLALVKAGQGALSRTLDMISAVL
jgi:3-deoxy-D-manno-octulosonic-acid transferase